MAHTRRSLIIWCIYMYVFCNRLPNWFYVRNFFFLPRLLLILPPSFQRSPIPNKTPVSSYLLYLICIRPLMNRYNIIYTFVSLFGCAFASPRLASQLPFVCYFVLFFYSVFQFNRFIQSASSSGIGKKSAFYNYNDTQALGGDGIFVYAICV